MSASATESLPPGTLPKSVSAKISSVQSRRRRISLLTALLAAATALAVTAIAAIATDWLSPLYDHYTRFALTLSTLAVAGITFALTIRRLRPRRGDVDLARQIDRTVAGLDERFTTLTKFLRFVVTLANPKRDSRSPLMRGESLGEFFPHARGS